MKTVLMMAAVAAVAASAQAQYTDNRDELLLGFTTPTSGGDLVIDLGQASSIISQSFLDLNVNGNVGESASALQTQLNGLYGSMSGLEWGVVGGHYTSGLNSSIYSTVPDGTAPPSPGNPGQIVGAINTAGHGLNDFATGNQGIVNPTAGYAYSWTEIIGPGTINPSFSHQYYNPNSTTPGGFSGGMVEDLYVSTATHTTPQLLGTITLYSSGDVQWNATSVPEPATYSLLGGLGVLALAFRRQFNRK